MFSSSTSTPRCFARIAEISSSARERRIQASARRIPHRPPPDAGSGTGTGMFSAISRDALDLVHHRHAASVFDRLGHGQHDRMSDRCLPQTSSVYIGECSEYSFNSASSKPMAQFAITCARLVPVQMLASAEDLHRRYPRFPDPVAAKPYSTGGRQSRCVERTWSIEVLSILPLSPKILVRSGPPCSQPESLIRIASTRSTTVAAYCHPTG